MGESGQALRRLHLLVRGRVQGVGFRWFVRERARALGLRGWVRNTAEGTVEVLAIGDAARLELLREHLKTGPAAAQVSSVDERSEPPEIEAMDPFGVLR
jgi:acylphosphatase